MPDPDTRRFFMCFVPSRSGNSPSTMHPSRAIATAEASRLASKERAPVFVLEAVACFAPASPPVVEVPMQLPATVEA